MISIPSVTLPVGLAMNAGEGVDPILGAGRRSTQASLWGDRWTRFRARRAIRIDGVAETLGAINESNDAVFVDDSHIVGGAAAAIH